MKYHYKYFLLRNHIAQSNADLFEFSALLKLFADFKINIQHYFIFS